MYLHLQHIYIYIYMHVNICICLCFKHSYGKYHAHIQTIWRTYYIYMCVYVVCVSNEYYTIHQMNFMSCHRCGSQMSQTSASFLGSGSFIGISTTIPGCCSWCLTSCCFSCWFMKKNICITCTIMVTIRL